MKDASELDLIVSMISVCYPVDDLVFDMDRDEGEAGKSIGELVKKIEGMPEKVTPILTVSLEPRSNGLATKAMTLQGDLFNEGKVAEALALVIP